MILADNGVACIATAPDSLSLSDLRAFGARAVRPGRSQCIFRVYGDVMRAGAGPSNLNAPLSRT